MITDKAHTFHPIAFCISSHKKETDFNYFFFIYFDRIIKEFSKNAKVATKKNSIF